MRLVVLLVALAGCGAPKIAYWTTSSPNDWKPRSGPDGKCRATVEVKVVDEAGAPVAGAEVILQQREQVAMPSTVPTDVMYQTAPVRTDANGEAVTCKPDDVPQAQNNMFGRVHDGRFRARLGTLNGSVPASYASTPVIVLRPGPDQSGLGALGIH